MRHGNPFTILASWILGLAIASVSSVAHAGSIVVSDGGGGLWNFTLDVTGMVNGFDTFELKIESAALLNQTGAPGAGVVPPSLDSGFRAALTLPAGQDLSAFGIGASTDTASLVQGTHASLGNNNAANQGNYQVAQVVLATPGLGSFEYSFFDDGFAVGEGTGSFGVPEPSTLRA